jgi:hypothetical protein
MTIGSNAQPVGRPAAAPRHQRGHVSSYGVGRVCAAAECHTTLSRYNSSELCYPHADEARLRLSRS